MKINNKKILILITIIIVGAFLRLWRIGEFPVGFTADEASQGYTAYSLAETGKDEWGVQWPLNPRSFGDFKPPLQTYLIIPSVKMFGLNKFSVRLPNALLGSLAVIGIFLLAAELFNNQTVGLISAGILAFSPWHWVLSRVAVEANLTVFFISFGLYFLIKKKQIPAAIFLGLNLFTYHSAKIATPMIVLIFILKQLLSAKGLMLNVIKDNISKNSKFLIVFTVFLLIAFSSFFSGGDVRGMDVAIFNPTDNWQVVKDFQWWSRQGNLPPIFGRLLHNKATYTLSKFVENYLSYFSARFLFLEGASDATYGMIPGYGVLWWWQLPIIIFGLINFIKKGFKNNNTIVLLFLIILVSPLPAALTKGSRMANRSAVMMPFLQIFTSWCIWKFFNFQPDSRQSGFPILKKIILPVFIVIVFYSFISYLEVYFVQSPRLTGESMLYGRCEAVNYVKNNYSNYEQIIMSRSLSEPQTFVMFCQHYSPSEVQKESNDWLRYEKEGFSFLDQLGKYSLGKYVFKRINWETDSRQKNTVIIGKPEEFPSYVEPDKIIRYPDEKKAIFIVKT